MCNIGIGIGLAENIRIMKKEKREPWHIKTIWL